jgi:hypothetical protein
MSEKKFMDNPVLDGEIEIRKLANSGYRFYKKATIKALSADVPVSILLKDSVIELAKSLGLSGAKIEGFKIANVGAVAWVGVGLVLNIQDTAGTPNSLVAVPVASLGANAFVNENTAGITLSALYKQSNVIPDQEGIQVSASIPGTAGSDLVVQVWGRIE